MTTYHIDRAWSDQYLPVIQRFVGPRLLAPSHIDIDRKQATDMVTLTVQPRAIACRVRRHDFVYRYPTEFTIRAARDSGVETELSKILDGFADWMFYGFAGKMGGLCLWYLLDLDVFREVCYTTTFGTTRKSNGDGSHFESFDLRTFPEAHRLVLDRWAAPEFAHLLPEL